MRWFERSKILGASLAKKAGVQIVYDDEGLKNEMMAAIERVRSYYQGKEQYRGMAFDSRGYLQEAQKLLAGIGDAATRQDMDQRFMVFLAQAEAAHRAGTAEFIKPVFKMSYDLMNAISEKMKEALGKPHDTNDFMSLRGFFDLTDRIGDQLEILIQEEGAEATAAEKYRLTLEEESKKVLGQVEKLRADISQVVAGQPTDVNVKITWVAGGDGENQTLYPGRFDIEVDFGNENVMVPRMSISTDEKGGYRVDEMLDYGDTDFFVGDEDSRFYFDLANFLRTGKLPASGDGSKFITLYRGMSDKESDVWQSGEVIKKGKFFTSVRTHGLAKDISGEFPELYTFKVRDDAVRETTQGTYQLVKDCVMDEKRRIVPM